MTKKQCGDRGVDQDPHPDCENCILKKYDYLCLPDNTCVWCVDTTPKDWKAILSARAKKERYRELVAFKAAALKVTPASDSRIANLPNEGDPYSDFSDDEKVELRLVVCRSMSDMSDWTSDSSYDSSTTSKEGDTSMSYPTSDSCSSAFSMAPKTRAKKGLSKLEDEMINSAPKRNLSADNPKRRKLTEDAEVKPTRQFAVPNRERYEYQREPQYERRQLAPQHVSRYYHPSNEFDDFQQRSYRAESEFYAALDERSPQPPQLRRMAREESDDDDFVAPTAKPDSKKKLKHRDTVDAEQGSAKKTSKRKLSRDMADEQFQKENFSENFHREQLDIQRQIERAYNAGLKAQAALESNPSPRKPKRKVVIVPEPEVAPRRSKAKPLPDFSSEEEDEPELEGAQEQEDSDGDEAELESLDEEEAPDEKIDFKVILKFMAACSGDSELIELSDDGYKSSIVLKSSQKMKENKFYGLTTASSITCANTTWSKSFKTRDNQTADKPLKLLELFRAKLGRPGMKPYKSGDESLPAASLKQPSSRYVWSVAADSKMMVAQSDVSYLEEVSREGLRILSFLEILNQAINRALTDKMSHSLLAALHASSVAASKDLLLVNTILTGACVQLKRDNFLLGCTALDASQKSRLRHEPWTTSTDLFSATLMDEIDKEHSRFLLSKSMSSKSSDKRSSSKPKASATASASRGNQR